MEDAVQAANCALGPAAGNVASRRLDAAPFKDLHTINPKTKPLVLFTPFEGIYRPDPRVIGQLPVTEPIAKANYDLIEVFINFARRIPFRMINGQYPSPLMLMEAVRRDPKADKKSEEGGGGARARRKRFQKTLPEKKAGEEVVEEEEEADSDGDGVHKKKRPKADVEKGPVIGYMYWLFVHDEAPPANGGPNQACTDEIDRAVTLAPRNLEDDNDDDDDGDDARGKRGRGKKTRPPWTLGECLRHMFVPKPRDKRAPQGAGVHDGFSKNRWREMCGVYTGVPYADHLNKINSMSITNQKHMLYPSEVFSLDRALSLVAGCKGVDPVFTKLDNYVDRDSTGICGYKFPHLKSVYHVQVFPPPESFMVNFFPHTPQEFTEAEKRTIEAKTEALAGAASRLKDKGVDISHEMRKVLSKGGIRRAVEAAFSKTASLNLLTESARVFELRVRAETEKFVENLPKDESERAEKWERYQITKLKEMLNFFTASSNIATALKRIADKRDEILATYHKFCIPLPHRFRNISPFGNWLIYFLESLELGYSTSYVHTDIVAKLLYTRNVYKFCEFHPHQLMIGDPASSKQFLCKVLLSLMVPRTLNLVTNSTAAASSHGIDPDNMATSFNEEAPMYLLGIGPQKGGANKDASTTDERSAVAKNKLTQAYQFKRTSEAHQDPGTGIVTYATKDLVTECNSISFLSCNLTDPSTIPDAMRTRYVITYYSKDRKRADKPAGFIHRSSNGDPLKEAVKGDCQRRNHRDQVVHQMIRCAMEQWILPGVNCELLELLWGAIVKEAEKLGCTSIQEARAAGTFRELCECICIQRVIYLYYDSRMNPDAENNDFDAEQIIDLTPFLVVTAEDIVLACGFTSQSCADPKVTAVTRALTKKYFGVPGAAQTNDRELKSRRDEKYGDVNEPGYYFFRGTGVRDRAAPPPTSVLRQTLLMQSRNTDRREENLGDGDNAPQAGARAATEQKIPAVDKCGALASKLGFVESSSHQITSRVLFNLCAQQVINPDTKESVPVMKITDDGLYLWKDVVDLATVVNPLMTAVRKVMCQARIRKQTFVTGVPLRDLPYIMETMDVAPDYNSAVLNVTKPDSGDPKLKRRIMDSVTFANRQAIYANGKPIREFEFKAETLTQAEVEFGVKLGAQCIDIKSDPEVYVIKKHLEKQGIVPDEFGQYYPFSPFPEGQHKWVIHFSKKYLEKGLYPEAGYKFATAQAYQEEMQRVLEPVIPAVVDQGIADIGIADLDIDGDGYGYGIPDDPVPVEVEPMDEDEPGELVPARSKRRSPSESESGRHRKKNSRHSGVSPVSTNVDYEGGSDSDE